MLDLSIVAKFCLLFLMSVAAICFVLAWTEGRLSWFIVMEQARYALADAEIDNTLKCAEALTSPLLASIGDEIGLFECAGCDGHFIRNQPGYVRIGDYFEFCSEQCRQDPVPFPSIANVGVDRSLN